MKEMARIQGGIGFYGEMPDMYNVVLNADHKLIKNVLTDAENACKDALKPIEEEIEQLDRRHEELHKAKDGKKEDEVPQAEKDELEEVEKKLTAKRSQKDAVISDYAQTNKVVHQLIDLALLQNNLLKGEALDAFVKRSIELI